MKMNPVKIAREHEELYEIIGGTVEKHNDDGTSSYTYYVRVIDDDRSGECWLVQSVNDGTVFRIKKDLLKKLKHKDIERADGMLMSEYRRIEKRRKSERC